jgi:diadenosine tetraphosphate (Ap4A) HIT family hydrolase
MKLEHGDILLHNDYKNPPHCLLILQVKVSGVTSFKFVLLNHAMSGVQEMSELHIAAAATIFHNYIKIGNIAHMVKDACATR